MARGKTLGQLVVALRHEARHSPDAALGLNTLASIKEALARTQERLYDAYDWPFLNIYRDIVTVPGQRYYDFPTDLNPEAAAGRDPIHRPVAPCPSWHWRGSI